MYIILLNLDTYVIEETTIPNRIEDKMADEEGCARYKSIKCRQCSQKRVMEIWQLSQFAITLILNSL